MRVCAECGKTLETGGTRCPDCGSTKVSFTSEPQVREQDAAAPDEQAGPKIIFDRGHAHPAGDASDPGLSQPAEDLEDSWIQKIMIQLTHPKFWLFAGLGLLLLGGVVWWALTPRGPEVQEVAADPNAVNPVLAKEFSKMVDSGVAEKLEWGREVMKRRTPSRFPEELMIDTERDKAEIRFSNDEKTEAYYRFMMAYHYKETHKKLYQWTSVAFFFELRGGKWVMTGDRWPREWEVVFE